MNRLESPNNPVLQRDLEEIVSGCPVADCYAGRSILVTGATGLVGSALVRALACMNRMKQTDIQILAQVRNAEKARKVFGQLLDRGDVKLVLGDVSQMLEIAGPVDVIFHTASVTASKLFVTQPVQTLTTAIDGTRNLLELARAKQVKAMVYISSMEAFGITDPALPLIRETDLGYIDILNVRSSYSEGKRICECLCAAYAGQYGVNVVIARLAQTFGAGVGCQDGRVFAQFARSAMAGENLVLHTQGTSMGNYCYTADAVSALLLLAARGRAGEAYTVVNENTTMQIRQMAQVAIDALAREPVELVFDIPEDRMVYGYAPDVTMHLSGEKLRALGWTPKVDLPEMFARLGESFRLEESQ